MEQLLLKIIQFFEGWIATNQSGAATAQSVLAEIKSCTIQQKIHPSKSPSIQKWFQQCQTQKAPQSCKKITASLSQTFDQLAWHHSPEDYMGADFAARFAFTQIIGPWDIDGIPPIYKNEKIAAGFSIQAPNLFYPPHFHKAQEFYGVLSGTARWQLGHAPPAPQPPGSYIFHDIDVPHAMETADEPLLCIWAWTGDLHSPIEVPSHSWLEEKI